MYTAVLQWHRGYFEWHLCYKHCSVVLIVEILYKVVRKKPCDKDKVNSSQSPWITPCEVPPDVSVIVLDNAAHNVGRWHSLHKCQSMTVKSTQHPYHPFLLDITNRDEISKNRPGKSSQKVPYCQAFRPQGGTFGIFTRPGSYILHTNLGSLRGNKHAALLNKIIHIHLQNKNINISK